MKGLWNRYRGEGRVNVAVGRVNEGDKGEGIWLTGFLYIYEIQ
jgi:hypothetical protein